MKICSTCIYSEKVPGISFNDEGICSYCLQIDTVSETFQTGTEEGENKFLDIVSEIKKHGKGKKYDVIIGVSGGTDSSYLLHLAIQLGLRPLAVHYDNTWNTAIATQNIKKMVTKLDVDLETYVIDNQEQDNIMLSFFKAGICGLDAATDLALAEVMYRYANKYKINYVFEGHSFVAEGISPISTSYTDGKFIKSVVKEHSEMRLKSYPLMTFFQFLRWTVFNRIKKIRPLWYLEYDKESYIERKFFFDSPYRKIKHQLILDITTARLDELIDVCYEKNTNLNYFRQNNNNIYINIEKFEYFKNIQFALQKNKFIDPQLVFGENIEDCSLSILNGTAELIGKGWEKEAIPVIQTKKSIISSFFSRLFS